MTHLLPTMSAILQQEKVFCVNSCFLFPLINPNAITRNNNKIDYEDDVIDGGQFTVHKQSIDLSLVVYNGRIIN